MNMEIVIAFKEIAFKIVLACVCVFLYSFFFPFDVETYSVNADVVGFETRSGSWGSVHDYVIVSYDDEIYKVEDTKLYSNSSVGDTVSVSFNVVRNPFNVIVRKYIDYSSYGKENLTNGFAF